MFSVSEIDEWKIDRERPDECLKLLFPLLCLLFTREMGGGKTVVLWGKYALYGGRRNGEMCFISEVRPEDVSLFERCPHITL